MVEVQVCNWTYLLIKWKFNPIFHNDLNYWLIGGFNFNLISFKNQLLKIHFLK